MHDVDIFCGQQADSIRHIGHLPCAKFEYIMNGEAVEEDEDDRSAGQFSNNYIWEETVGDAICRNVFAHK